jgi:hypothetical protein
MTSIEELTAAVRAGRVREIAGLADVMSEYERAMVELDSLPYVRSEKEKRRLEAEAAVRTRVSELVEQARAKTMGPFDQEEGAIRRRALAIGDDATDNEVRRQVAKSTRAGMLALQVDRAPSAAAVRTLYREAQLAADTEMVRVVGFAARNRLHALAASDKDKDYSAARDAALQFEGEFSQWERANPSPVQRLDEIQRLRGNAMIEFQASADFTLSLFGIGRELPTPALKSMPDVPRSDTGIRIGPGFDLLASPK